MARRIARRPRAPRDLVEIWIFIVRGGERAADRLLDRIEGALGTLADNPLIGRARPELALDLRSFAVGCYVPFYRPLRTASI